MILLLFIDGGYLASSRFHFDFRNFSAFHRQINELIFFGIINQWTH